MVKNSIISNKTDLIGLNLEETCLKVNAIYTRSDKPVPAQSCQGDCLIWANVFRSVPLYVSAQYIFQGKHLESK